MQFLTPCSIFNIVFILYAFKFDVAHGLFTQTSCWLSNCIRQNSQGRWCYAPSPQSTSNVACSREFSCDRSMSAVMAFHLKQGLSIAYYSGVDNVLLGGADFPFPASGGFIMLCASGKAGDGNFQTLCQRVHQDNDIYGVPGDPWCLVSLDQDFVLDGCYVPRSGVVSLNSASSSNSQTISSSLQTTSPIASTMTLGATVTTPIVVNGTIQTIVIVNNNTNTNTNTNNSGSDPSGNPVLPTVLSVLGTILIVICLGAWWRRKHLRLQQQVLNPLMEHLPMGVSAYTHLQRWFLIFLFCVEPTFINWTWKTLHSLRTGAQLLSNYM